MSKQRLKASPVALRDNASQEVTCSPSPADYSLRGPTRRKSIIRHNSRRLNFVLPAGEVSHIAFQ